MKRREELTRRLRSLEGLSAAVSAMKSLSAHHFRAVRAEVEPCRSYREGVERLRPFALRRTPPSAGPVGLVVIGAELGLCGGYNAHVVAAAAQERAARGPGRTLCVGRRAATLLARRDVTVDAIYPGPASAAGITDVLLSLAEHALSAYEADGMSALHVVSSRFRGVGVDAPTVTRLLPLERPAAIDEAPSAGGAPGTPRYVAADHLAAAVTRELLYVELFDLLLDALACEHGARIVATQAAGDWLDERTGEVRRHLVSARREASTQEVIEIAGGVRARAHA